MDRRNKLPYGTRGGEKDLDEIKPVVEFSSMSNEMRDMCIEKAKDAMDSFKDANISYYKKLAKKIKTDLEIDKNETWNCIVGTDFGAFISFEKAYLVYFRLNELYFMIFRFGAGAK